MDRLKSLPVIGTVLRVQERYTADAADALAASIGLFGFLSLFPLLALLLAFIGFALQGDVAAQNQAAELVQESIPGFSALLGGGEDEQTRIAAAFNDVANNAPSLLGVGSITLLLAGLRIASGAQQATSVVFRRELPGGLAGRFEQIRGLVVVGAVALAGAALTGTVGVDLGGGVAGLATSLFWLALSFGADTAMFLLAYRLFTPGEGPAWRMLLPGSLLAALGWVLLKLFGTAYVTSQAQAEDSTFGALAPVVALLLVLYLAGRLFLYGAEFAAVRSGIGLAPRFDDVLEDAVPVPVVSPRPVADVAPSPRDSSRLAASVVVLAGAAVLADRLLRR